MLMPPVLMLPVEAPPVLMPPVLMLPVLMLPVLQRLPSAGRVRTVEPAQKQTARPRGGIRPGPAANPVRNKDPEAARCGILQ